MTAFTPAPTPPSRADRPNFAARGDIFFLWLATFAAELNAALGTIAAGDMNVTGNTVLGSASGNTVRIRQGTLALPALTAFGDDDTGVYFPAANTLAFAAGGVNQMTVGTSGVALAAGSTIGGRAIGFRGLPQNAQTDAYVLSAADAGRRIDITLGGVTVPAGVFNHEEGDAVVIYNASAAAQTITQGAGTTLRQAGTTNAGNRSLAAHGLCTVLCVAADVFVVTGHVS